MSESEFVCKKPFILKILSILSILIIMGIGVQTVSAQALWDGTADSAWYKSDTSASAYTISTAEELAGLAKLVNSGTARFILGHLSRENNTSALAYENAVKRLAKSSAVFGTDYTLEIAPVITEGRMVAV